MPKMPPKKSKANVALGAAIRAERESRGQSQEVFANKAGIDRSYYGAIERGEFNITVDTLLTIACGLEITVAELLQVAGL
jgi:transcriptional regulator with XRE-family HTH domain